MLYLLKRKAMLHPLQMTILSMFENFSLLSHKHPEESCVDDEASIHSKKTFHSDFPSRFRYLCSERETRERRKKGKKRKRPSVGIGEFS
ncbi:hypothetical protein CDAR_296131 [Caerostris darwini]|uniref:Ycf2 n=1 Tax=Caerostris darwini TaxID=1538125 RepID=A0AAV4USJ7_9ARAC|nr:hypothetical protein CDAR_296131 [Caerostris darwini]